MMPAYSRQHVLSISVLGLGIALLSCLWHNLSLRVENQSLIEQAANADSKSAQLQSDLVNLSAKLPIPLYLKREAYDHLRVKGFRDPENQIKRNLLDTVDLIPYEHGYGRSYVFTDSSEIWIFSRKWALATFEDGHVTGKALLDYTVSDSGEISWKVLATYIDD